MKIIKNLLIVTIFSLSSSAFANSKLNDYGANYYEDEGSLLFKVRGFYSITSAKLKGLPAIRNAGASTPGTLVANGFGFDTATAFFFTDNIAAELSLGLGYYRTKNTALNDTLKAYGAAGATSSSGKKNDIYMVPLAATAQYHIAPFGAIRPYVGGGYHGTYMFTRSKAISVSPGHGPVLQAGIDFIAKDDTLFTIDVRQYFLKSKVTFKDGFLKAPGISSKVAWNPLVISAGFGFKFK